MAAFPSIEPLTREYGMGDHVMSVFTGQNGDTMRFLHSTLAADVSITLGFRALTLTQAQQIRDHYTGQRGGVRSFSIPVHLWRTHTDPYDVVPPGVEWRYAAPPQEQRLSGGLFDVSVDLVSAIP